jgi:predicted MFS family arabinose efflux permease
LATLAVAALLWFVVPDRSRIAAPDDGASSLAGVGRVFSSRNFWTITPIAATLMGTFLAIQSLWSGPWLRDVAGLDTDRAASVLLVAAFGFIVGNVLNGTLAVWAGRRGISTPLLLVFGIALFMLLQIALVAGWTAHIDILWFAFGYLGTTGILTYSVLTRTFPMHLAGRATTAMNLVVFVAAFALQWGMGVVINQWPVAADGGFDPRGYQAAFAFALALQVASFIVFLIGYRKLVPIEE